MQRDLQLGFEFLLGIAAVGLPVYAFFKVFMLQLQGITAFFAAIVLNFLGIAATASANLVHAAGMSAQVVPLCVGDFEAAILIGAIASTKDRKLHERLGGCFAAFFFVLLVNGLRVGLTIAAGVTHGIVFMEFVHTMLFRITLVIALVGFYAAWYLK